MMSMDGAIRSYWNKVKKRFKTGVHSHQLPCYLNGLMGERYGATKISRLSTQFSIALGLNMQNNIIVMLSL